ncbi:MAG: hypothetical protein FWD58_03165 [Firmicutes bacterium]|nr:hypothetical protein [Bacillota bacterium]
MKTRQDFFGFYISAKNEEIAIDDFTFDVYEALPYEALEFFETEDRLDGKFYSKAFRLLYLESDLIEENKSRQGRTKELGRIDAVSSEVGIDQKTLYKYRLRFDAFARIKLEGRGYEVTSGKNRPIQIVKRMV